MRHRQQERAQRAAAPVVPVEAFPQPHEHFLADFFGVRPVTHEPALRTPPPVPGGAA